MRNSQPVTIAIEKLAGLGDGMGLHEGRKIFVSCTVPGDVVEATIVKRTTDADYARLERVLSAGAHRKVPVCRHFGVCGGCSLQHLEEGAYRDFKEDMARMAVRKAGYSPESVQPVVGFPAASRRRVELKISGGELGYYAERSHQLTPIRECKVLEPELEQLVLRLGAYCKEVLGLRSIQINGLDRGYDLLLEGEGIERWDFVDAAICRVTSRGAGGTHVLYQSGEATITLGGVKVFPPAGAFLQAVRAAQEVITSLVVEAVGDAASVLDLFSGLGTYSFPLAAQSRVLAVESEAAMVQAMREAIIAAGLRDVMDVRRRDLFREPVKARELARHEAIVLNPPRAGAQAQCAEIAQTRVPVVVMVSCNPATFARDAKMLREGGYHLRRLTPVDQFFYSSHLECVAEFAI